MSIRWRRIVPIALPALMVAIAFTVYVYSQPTTRCVIINESLQTTIKASGQRCTELLSEEESVMFTRDGVYGVGEGL